jgi:hypothetical protein
VLRIFIAQHPDNNFGAEFVGKERSPVLQGFLLDDEVADRDSVRGAAWAGELPMGIEVRKKILEKEKKNCSTTLIDGTPTSRRLLPNELFQYPRQKGLEETAHDGDWKWKHRGKAF